ncbi:response regulator [Gemmatimonas sp.]
MLQANQTSPIFSSTYAPPATYGRPKRGTPAYAAAVRSQIARLAALHAATVAEAPPAAPIAVQTVLLVSPCLKVRTVLHASLREHEWVRVVDAASADEAKRLLKQHTPQLVVIDQSEVALLSSSPGARVVLIADSVPRSTAGFGALAGVLARPLNPVRVAERVLTLLEETVV